MVWAAAGRKAARELSHSQPATTFELLTSPAARARTAFTKYMKPSGLLVPICQNMTMIEGVWPHQPSDGDREPHKQSSIHTTTTTTGDTRPRGQQSERTRNTNPLTKPITHSVRHPRAASRHTRATSAPRTPLDHTQITLTTSPMSHPRARAAARTRSLAAPPRTPRPRRRRPSGWAGAPRSSRGPSTSGPRGRWASRHLGGGFG